MKIWLDDIRPAPDGWIWIKSYGEFMECLYDPHGYEELDGFVDTDSVYDYIIEEISFDHDLGRNGAYPSIYDKTGYDVAKGFVDFHIDEDYWSVVWSEKPQWPKWKVHSANPVGAENIRKLLENYEKHIKNEK